MRRRGEPREERGERRAERGKRREERGEGHLPSDANHGASTRETTLMSLIKMFMAGPEVSLKGSPTVSPTTAALWGSEPLPPRAPASICFLALSQAPPALAMKRAIM